MAIPTGIVTSIITGMTIMIMIMIMITGMGTTTITIERVSG